MRKLATAAVSFSGAAALAFYLLPSSALLWCAAFSAAASLIGLAFKEDARRRVRIIAAGLAAGFLWTYVYTAVFVSPAKAFDGKIETVSAVVADYPEATDYGQRVTVRLKAPGCPPIKTRLYAYDRLPVLKPGYEIEFTAKFTLTDKSYGAPADMLLSKGIFLSANLKGELTVAEARTPVSYFPAAVARAVTEKIGRLFSGSAAGLIKALLVGDTSGVNSDRALSGALSATGTAHIISVSGMNVAFLMGFLGALIKKKRLLAAVGIPVVLFFMAVVGFQAPVTRAGIMQIFILSAPLLKREADALTSLSASLLLLLVLNPFSVGSIGLQLSFSATLGLILCSEKLYNLLDALVISKKTDHIPVLRSILRFAVTTTAATAGALVFSVPLIALHFGTVSLIAPLSNIAVLWAVTLVFIGGAAAVAAGFVYMPLGAAAAWAVSLPARFVIAVITRLSRLPLAAVYTSNPAVVAWLLTAYLTIAAFILLRDKLSRWIIPACLSVATLCLVVLFASVLGDHERLTVTALDVGQGQSVVIMSGGFTGVVDCGGSGAKDAGDILTQFLHSRGRTAIDLLILTHYHRDHADGVARALALNRVLAIAAPDPSLDDGALSAEILKLAADKKIRLITVTEDMRFVCGSTRLTIYAPLGDIDENERGLSVLCTENGFDALITGDMSAEIESLLVAGDRLPDIELLIAGHHGSKHSTSRALLDAARPEAAVISVGRNAYGHPAPETLKRLFDSGVAVYRTDLLGNVTVRAP